MKRGISERMKVFLDRAEQLKPVVEKMGGRAAINISITSVPSNNGALPPCMFRISLAFRIRLSHRTSFQLESVRHVVG